MAKTRTNSLLNLLDEAEQKALGKALLSPFFPAKKFLPSLYEQQLRRGEQSTEETQESMFDAVFPEKAFGNGRTWTKALSDLNVRILRFLAIRQTLDDPLLYRQAELTALAGREDEDFFQQRVEAALTMLEKAPESTDGWQLRFRVQQHATAYRLTNRIHEPETLLDELDKTLDCYHAICKLQLACNRASLAPLQKNQTDVEALRRLLDETEALDRSGQSALLSLYRAALRLLTDPAANLMRFARILHAHAPPVARAELQSILLLGFNYCIRRYRQGDVRALRWYRIGFYWADTHRIWTSPATHEAFFLNTAVLFAKIQDRKGFEDLLKYGAKAFPKQRRENAVSLLRAYWHNYAGEFHDAARLLPPGAQFRHPRYALLYHSLKVRNTYEEWLHQSRKVRNTFKEWQLAESSDKLARALVNFEAFLNRPNLFADSFCQSYRDLIWFIRQLAKPKCSKKNLEKELKKRQPAMSDWVAAKIDGLPA